MTTRLAIILLAILGLQATETFAQDFALESIAISKGESPIASGLTAVTRISHGENNFKFSANKDDGYMLYQINDFGAESLSTSPTLGIYKNVPYVGNRITYWPHERLRTLVWYGFSFGDALSGIPGARPNFFFLQGDVQALIGDNTTVGFSYLQIVETDYYLPYVSQAVPLNERLALFGSITYDITNTNPQFLIGVSIGF